MLSTSEDPDVRDEIANLVAPFLRKNVRKATATSRASLTATATDPELTVPVAANTDYSFEALIIYEADAAADIKWTLNVPAGATAMWTSTQPATSAASVPSGIQGGATYVAADVAVAGGVGAGVKAAVILKGVLKVGATAGNLDFNWAQNATSVVPTIVHINSELTVVKTGPF